MSFPVVETVSGKTHLWMWTTTHSENTVILMPEITFCDHIYDSSEIVWQI